MAQKILKLIKNFFIRLENFKQNFFLNSKKNYDVFIYDAVFARPIIECVPSSKKIYVMKTRELYFYLNLNFIRYFLFFFLRKELFFFIFIYGLKKGIFRYGYDSFYAALISQINPKVIITNVDNNPRFGRLFLKFKNIRFVTIQNGSSTRWEDAESCINDIFLSFTSKEALTFNKLGWIINHNYSVGSLNAARIFSRAKPKKEKRDILIISTWWRGNQEQLKAMEEMHIYLNKLIRKEKYNAEIILRNQRKSNDCYLNDLDVNEAEFYKKIYGYGCKIIENRNSREDIYKEINESYLSVSLLSSAILEGHLYGHNCFYLNFHKDNYYHQDFPSEIVLSKTNLDYMSFEISKKIKDSKIRNSEIMSISKTRSEITLKKIKQIINESFK